MSEIDFTTLSPNDCPLLEQPTNDMCMGDLIKLLAFNTAVLERMVKGSIVPAGIVSYFAGQEADIPARFIICDGSYYDPNTYPELFAKIKYTYGRNVDNCFAVPDLRVSIIQGLALGSECMVASEEAKWEGKTPAAGANVQGNVVGSRIKYPNSSPVYNSSNPPSESASVYGKMALIPIISTGELCGRYEILSTSTTGCTGSSFTLLLNDITDQLCILNEAEAIVDCISLSAYDTQIEFDLLLSGDDLSLTINGQTDSVSLSGISGGGGGGISGGYKTINHEIAYLRNGNQSTIQGGSGDLPSSPPISLVTDGWILSTGTTYTKSISLDVTNLPVNATTALVHIGFKAVSGQGQPNSGLTIYAPNNAGVQNPLFDTRMNTSFGNADDDDIEVANDVVIPITILNGEVVLDAIFNHNTFYFWEMNFFIVGYESTGVLEPIIPEIIGSNMFLLDPVVDLFPSWLSGSNIVDSTSLQILGVPTEATKVLVRDTSVGLTRIIGDDGWGLINDSPSETWVSTTISGDLPLSGDVITDATFLAGYYVPNVLSGNDQGDLVLVGNTLTHTNSHGITQDVDLTSLSAYNGTNLAVINQTVGGQYSNGGTTTPDTWRTIPYNTIAYDPASIVTSLTTNRFTLGIGVYYIRVPLYIYMTDQAFLRIYNITDNAVSIYGNGGGFASGIIGQFIERSGILIVSGTPKEFEAQIYSTDSGVIHPVNVPTNVNDPLIRQQIFITKLS